MDTQESRFSRTLASFAKTWDTMVFKRKPHSQQPRLPPPSTARLRASLNECTVDIHEYLEQSELKRGTVLYLGYGSNLSNETFRGKRGIKPLAQINVQVPSLRVTFDLPGIAYTEPCFANSGRRDPDNDPPNTDVDGNLSDEKSSLLPNGARKKEYRKNNWHKGLIGVVYEVTAQDYAHIIQTEGGGSSYQDILVDCHPFESTDPTTPVPQNPTLPAFKAHTLFAPAVPPGEQPPEDGGRLQRPDTSYAQPSARYLKLMKDGAAELELPYEYQDYLHSIRPYTITTTQQRIGQFIFLGLWVPIVMAVFSMSKMFADKKGRLPPWLVQLTGAIFKAAWASYDNFFKKIFGDGERTIGCDDENSAYEESRRQSERRASANLEGPAIQSELEKTVSSQQYV